MIHYTTIEQSKHLMELGLSAETADMLWEQHNREEPYVTIKPWTTKGKSIGAHILPCWSLTALLEAMPKAITDEYDSKGWLGMSTLYNSTWGWIVYYSNADADCQALHEEQGDTLLDAAYNMVCWLIEEGHIKKEV